MREFLSNEFERSPQEYTKACNNLRNTIKELEAVSEDNYLLLVPYQKYLALEPIAFSKGLARSIDTPANIEIKTSEPINSKNDLSKLQPVLKDIIDSEGSYRYIIFCNENILGEIESYQGMEFVKDYVSKPVTIKDDAQNIKRFIRDLSGTKASKNFKGSISHLPDLQFYTVLNTLSSESVTFEEISSLESAKGDIFLPFKSYKKSVKSIKSLYLDFLGIRREDLDIASYTDSRKALYNLLNYRKFQNTESDQIKECFQFGKFDKVADCGKPYIEFLQRLSVESVYMRHPYIQIEDSFSSRSEQQELRNVFERITGSSFSMNDMSKNGKISSEYLVEIIAGKNTKNAIDIAFCSSIVNRKLKKQVENRIGQEDQVKQILANINKVLSVIKISQIIHEDIKEDFVYKLVTKEEFFEPIQIVLKRNIENRNNKAVEKFSKVIHALNQNELIKILDESRTKAALENKERELEELDTDINGLNKFLESWYSEVIRPGDSPFKATLSKKYLEMNQWLMDQYKEIDMNKTNDLIEKISGGREVNIVFVVDGFGWMDGLHLENSEKFEHNIVDMDMMFSVIPTLTPCAMPSLVTGYSPGELGILSKDIVYGNRQVSMFQNTSTLLEDTFENLEKINKVQYLITESLENTSITKVTECCAELEKISFSKANSERQYRQNILDKVEVALKNYLNGESDTIIVYSSDLEDIIHGPDTLISEEFHNLQTKFVNRVISDIDDLREELSIEEIDVIVTGDHGKITLDEKTVIERHQDLVWPGKKSIEKNIIDELNINRRLDFKRSSNGTGRFYAEWLSIDKEETNKLKEYTGSLQDSDSYVGDEVIDFFGEPLSKLSPPSLIMMSRYNYDTGSKNPGFSAHGGTSVSEIIVPAVKVNIRGDQNE